MLQSEFQRSFQEVALPHIHLAHPEKGSFANWWQVCIPGVECPIVNVASAHASDFAAIVANSDFCLEFQSVQNLRWFSQALYRCQDPQATDCKLLCSHQPACRALRFQAGATSCEHVQPLLMCGPALQTQEQPLAVGSKACWIVELFVSGRLRPLLAHRQQLQSPQRQSDL